MVEVMIGYNNDDYVKEKLSLRITRDHHVLSFVSFPKSLNTDILKKYITLKVKKAAPDEPYYTLRFAGSSIKCSINLN